MSCEWEMYVRACVRACVTDNHVNLALLFPRFEPDILLRAKQEFMKTDSTTDLE